MRFWQLSMIVLGVADVFWAKTSTITIVITDISASATAGRNDYVPSVIGTSDHYSRNDHFSGNSFIRCSISMRLPPV
jgi:hypothetical protein